MNILVADDDLAIRSLVGELLTDEFERNQRFLLADLEKTNDRALPLARALAEGGVDLEWFGPKTVRAARQLTQKRFLQLATPWLDPMKRVEVVLSPKKARR